MTRFTALDAFRGFTIAAMILVNTPGSWSHVYPLLQHAHWHGWTPTDFVFPFFLFIVGSAMYFSLPSQTSVSSTLIYRIIKRGAIIFLIGLFLSAYPFQNAWPDVRIMGVLQRIGISYILCSFIVLYCSRSMITIIAAILLLGYWAVLETFGDLTVQGNIVRQIDIILLGTKHMWSIDSIAFDPEGLLSTLPAIVSTLGGYEATRFLKKSKNYYTGAVKIATIGITLIAAGLIWNQWLPINKMLWTSSYVVFTIGIAMLTLALFIVIVDILKISWITKPCKVYGLNPLFIYIIAAIWVRTCVHLVHFTDKTGNTINAYDTLFNFLQSILGLNPLNVSLVFAIAHVILFWLIAHILYSRNIVIKI